MLSLGRKRPDMAAAANRSLGLSAAPRSDAVLNCPSCMTVLCLDCQRHETYHTQFRAMFVLNCKVDETETLTFRPPKGERRAKQRRHRGRQEQDDSGPSLDGPDEEYSPVVCSECDTVVAVYDADEVYHFFDVLATDS